MSEKPISPLRQRMIEDMTVRNFVEKTRNDYIRHVKTLHSLPRPFAGHGDAGGSCAASSCIRPQTGVRPPSINGSVAALRFFFTVTLDRPEMARHLTFVREPRKLPAVLSPEEVARLLEAAPGPKYKAALSAAYGAGLRVSEVVALKVSDIDSERLLLRIEQGKGRKDRFAMLSPQLLELLRDWYRIARPAVWLFPGRDPMLPMTTRQFNRAVHAAAAHGRDQEAGDAAHAAPQLCHPPARAEYRCSFDPGFARTCQARYDRALHAGRHQRDPRGHEPARSAHTADTQEERRSRRRNGARGPSSSGGRGYLPRPRTGVASSQCRPCEPRPAEGDVGDRALPHGGARRPCRALRGLRATRSIAYNTCRNRHCPKCQGAAARNGSPSAQAELLPVPYFHVVFTLPAAIADIAYQNKAVIYDLLFKASSETVLTIAADPKHLGARIGITAVLHTWGSTMTQNPHS